MICYSAVSLASIFFFNDTATTEIYTLSLHDALPISRPARPQHRRRLTRRRSGVPTRTRSRRRDRRARAPRVNAPGHGARSEEHTSELQSRLHLVCRLLLEKKKRHTSRRAVATTIRRA